MAESVEVLERRIDELRAAVRRAVMSGDSARAGALRAELRGAEREWDRAIAALAEDAERGHADEAEGAREEAGARAKQAGVLLPLREQVHHALTLLSVPAAPKLIVEVYNAFFGAGAGDLAGGRLTHLRRDEERSFRAAPYSRPYYLCTALTADYLAPARGLLAVSSWPLEDRIVGPLSPRVHFLTAAINIAEHAARLPSDGLTRLLWRFGANIPGAAETYDKPEALADAARAELKVHEDADRSHREAAAARARRQLDDVGQLFGSRLRVVGGTA